MQNNDGTRYHCNSGHVVYMIVSRIHQNWKYYIKSIALKTNVQLLYSLQLAYKLMVVR